MDSYVSNVLDVVVDGLAKGSKGLFEKSLKGDFKISTTIGLLTNLREMMSRRFGKQIRKLLSATDFVASTQIGSNPIFIQNFVQIYLSWILIVL